MPDEPYCAAQELFSGVNEVIDPNNLSDLEKMHLPVIDAPATVAKGRRFEATVEVGKLLVHPSEYRHFIQFIDIYADKTYLARADLTAVRTCPKVSFCLALQQPASELRAYAYCGMHGAWVGRKAITVKE